MTNEYIYNNEGKYNMNENALKLCDLIRNNPSLPVICMVDSDVVFEDYARWMASIGHCYLGEYACYDGRYFDDRDEFMEVYYDRNDEILDKRFGYISSMALPSASEKYSEEEIDINNLAETKLNEYLMSVADKAFRPAILVNIDVPDDDLILEVADEER